MIKALQLKQADIRSIQRERLDIIHAALHDLERDFFREGLGGKPRLDIKKTIAELHEIIHVFMKGFDEAVMIHERMAELKGDDPLEITKALLPVRTK